jgi:glycerophosphoryl diester phosphodiesterase
MRSSILWLLTLTIGVPQVRAAQTERLQVGGEWCFIKTPDAATRPREAVILIHGNGETVEADSSSWERSEANAALMETLLGAGFLVAQSNHTAVPGNGMWGNPATRRSVLALMDHLRSTRQVQVFHAIAVSAGNATLLNLLLDGKAAFRSAVLIAPVISLESLYRCPAGSDRVSGLAAAFDFRPAHGCPGEPEGDEAFRRATGPHDPLRKMRQMGPPAVARALSATRWMALYDRGDPKVIPEENLLPFVGILESARVGVLLRSQKRGTHDPRDLLLAHRHEIARFLVPASELSPRAVVNVAHRGGIVPGRPENTMAAFRRAIQSGADAIEIDLRGTKDGHVVVLHDETLDRTTNGTGRVTDHDLAQIKRLDLGGGARIPTYEEVLDLVSGTGTKLVLDIKLSPALDKPQVVRLTQKHRAVHDVILGVRSSEDLRAFRALDPELRTLGFVESLQDVEPFLAAGVDIVRLWPAWIDADPQIVPAIQKRGTPVWTTAGDAPRAQLERLVALGVTGILTDRPELLAEVLRTSQAAPASGARREQRLRVTGDGRWLERADGTPFFYLGDTAWLLLQRLDPAETERYLSNRAAKGFTVIMATVLNSEEGRDLPNAAGDLPLLDRATLAPNEVYFRHVDAVVRRANELGLVFGMLPTWGSYWKQVGREQAAVVNLSNARAYGRFLGERYRDADLIWILGGDQNVESDAERAVVDALAAGLREGDGGAHLMTFHPRGPGLSSTRLHDAPWLDFNMIQSSHGARDHDNGLFVEHDYALTPAKPTVDGEPRYERIPVGFYFAEHDRHVRFDDDDVRQAAYWSLLAGACGHTYGHNSLWQMFRPGLRPLIHADVPWSDALDHPGAFQMAFVRRLFESRPFTRLRPDPKMVVDGPAERGAKVRAVRAADGSFAFVYSPRGAPFTVDKSVIAGRRVREIWYDPRYGFAALFHTTDNTGFQTYTPPTSGRGADWILILESEAAGFPLPGPR